MCSFVVLVLALVNEVNIIGLFSPDSRINTEMNTSFIFPQSTALTVEAHVVSVLMFWSERVQERGPLLWRQAGCLVCAPIKISVLLTWSHSINKQRERPPAATHTDSVFFLWSIHDGPDVSSVFSRTHSPFLLTFR